MLSSELLTKEVELQWSVAADRSMQEIFPISITEWIWVHRNGGACLQLVVWWPPELVVSQVEVRDVDADQDVVLDDDE